MSGRGRPRKGSDAAEKTAIPAPGSSKPNKRTITRSQSMGEPSSKKHFPKPLPKVSRVSDIAPTPSTKHSTNTATNHSNSYNVRKSNTASNSPLYKNNQNSNHADITVTSNKSSESCPGLGTKTRGLASGTIKVSGINNIATATNALPEKINALMIPPEVIVSTKMLDFKRKVKSEYARLLNQQRVRRADEAKAAWASNVDNLNSKEVVNVTYRLL